jgi:hypothetical protein
VIYEYTWIRVRQNTAATSQNQGEDKRTRASTKPLPHFKETIN